ncbi:MAG: hypothetical protein HY662_03215 [Chloroflexi bacterium]|nr:hypothetical protein [Chloroflexota bacterium]
MFSPKRQRLVRIIGIVARVIGWGVTAFLFLASLIILNYGKFRVGDVLVLVSFGIALVGCIVSRWLEWLAGILLILASFGLVTGVYLRWTIYSAWQGVGLVLLDAGVLFLIASWLSRKT